jgi:CubicO group peptidase (beta-lactamase class C family)
MTDLQGLLESFVAAGELPGAVALVARGDRVERAAAGLADVENAVPMRPDALFRLASLTKPITAALVMTLVDEGVLGLDDPIARWLPELESPVVVRTPGSPLDDVVPAVRPVTVRDVLTSRAGWGFPSDFSQPAVQPLFEVLHQGPYSAQVPEPDAWIAALARIPLLHQPGEGWLYNTCSDLQGVLVARVTGRPLPEVLDERILAPLGLADTGFCAPAAARHRLTSAYRPAADGTLVLADPADGEAARMPGFPSGAGGLISTAADWLTFGRMLLAGGVAADGRRVLSGEAVRLMTTDHLTAEQRAAGALFLEGQGWGFGGSVDVERVDVWNVPGRYGWVGGTGTMAHVVPSTGTVTILLSQRELTGPQTTELMHAFWRYAGA